MVPLDSVVHVTRDDRAAGHQPLQPVPLGRDQRLGRRPGVSSGQAMQAMEQLAERRCRAGLSYEWAGMSLEEIKAGSAGALIFVLGLLLVYLVLAAQYESFMLPFIILLGVPLAVLGALSAQWLRGLPTTSSARSAWSC